MSGTEQRRRSFDPARAWSRLLGVLSSAARIIGTLAAGTLAAHVVLTLGNANPDNSITQFIANWAQPLSMGFHDLFQPDDPMLAVLLNYGSAAVFWLVITSIIMRILRLLG